MVLYHLPTSASPTDSGARRIFRVAGLIGRPWGWRIRSLCDGALGAAVAPGLMIRGLSAQGFVQEHLDVGLIADALVRGQGACLVNIRRRQA